MRILVPILLLGMAATAMAEDEVKLKNGDRITGKITGMLGGKLAITTPEAGPIKIDWTQIVSIKTDEPIKLKLATGEWLEGKISPGAEGKIKVDSAGASAPIEVEYGKVKSLNEPPTAWHGKLSAAAKAADGNTNNKSFLINGEATRETESDLLFAKVVFQYGETDGVLDERNSYGIGKYNLKLNPTLYLFVSEELSSDTFKDLSLSSVTAAGVGYTWFREPAIDFATEVGIAYMSNNFNIDPDESHVGARLAATIRLALPLGFEFKDSFTFYPNFEDSQDFQLRNEGTLGTSLGAGWDLLGGIITDYDKTPSTGRGRRDDTYFVGLGYTF